MTRSLSLGPTKSLTFSYKKNIISKILLNLPLQSKSSLTERTNHPVIKDSLRLLEG